MDLYLIQTALKLALKYATPTDYERVYPTIRAALAELEQAPAVEPAQSAAEPVASSFAPHMRFITNDELTEFQERNRARLEKSRLIDSPPTVPPAIDDETKRMALDFVRWIASLKIGGFIEARANDLLRLLEAGNGE